MGCVFLLGIVFLWFCGDIKCLLGLKMMSFLKDLWAL